jgi:hypothetical protein
MPGVRDDSELLFHRRTGRTRKIGEPGLGELHSHDTRHERGR